MVIKGLKGGILISLPSLSWHRQRDMVISRIQTQERFFKGGRIALDVGETDWTEEQLMTLMGKLSDEGVCLWAVLSASPTTIASARGYDIPTTLRLQVTEEVAETPRPSPVWLDRDLLPAELLETDWDVVIIGNIPETCVVKAGGSILVWGDAAGSIHAGMSNPLTSSLRVLRYAGASIFLGEEEVEIPRKLQKRACLEIRKVNEKIQVLEVSSKRGWLA